MGDRDPAGIPIVPQAELVQPTGLGPPGRPGEKTLTDRPEA
jgi:hypothetical protein